jgi:hypothetical protein
MFEHRRQRHWQEITAGVVDMGGKLALVFSSFLELLINPL